MKNKVAKRFALGIFVVVIIVVALAGVYFLFSGGDGGSNEDGGGDGDSGEVSSIDFRVQGFEGGILGGDMRCRAEGIGTETPNFRIDQLDGEEALIFNGDENVEYAYTGSSYMEIPFSQVSGYTELVDLVREMAEGGEGTYERTYEEWKVKVTINAVNPSLPDELFTPPENAKIEKLETS